RVLFRSRDGHALALAAGQPQAALADHRVELLRQPGHELRELRQAQRHVDAPLVDLAVAHAEGDVAAQAVVHQVGALGHVADAALPGAEAAADVTAVDGDTAAGR